MYIIKNAIAVAEHLLDQYAIAVSGKISRCIREISARNDKFECILNSFNLW